MSLPAAVYGVLMFFVALAFGFLIRGRRPAGAPHSGAVAVTDVAAATTSPPRVAGETPPAER
jgi:bile acid:Na+ symporter, BASS family